MNEDFKVFMEDFADFLNGMESNIVKMRMQLEKLTGSRIGARDSSRISAWDPCKISWSKAQGSRGEYERSEDVNCMDFKNLLKDLADHKGSLTRDDLFYWTFKNGATVGRKRRIQK